MFRAIFSVFGSIFSSVTNGLILVALSVGAIFFMYGRDLPDHEQLASYAPPMISRIYSGEGQLMDEFARERRLFAPSDEIPDMVKQAFISAEDKNFYKHAGYDPIGIISAALDAARGQGLRGASTITQQVMKNFLLSSDRSAERKIKELILASRIEDTLNKDDILELYMNEIFLGQNSFGVVAAAQTYFNKPLGPNSNRRRGRLSRGAGASAPATYHPVRQYSERAIEPPQLRAESRMWERRLYRRAPPMTSATAPATLDTVQGWRHGERSSCRPAAARLLHRRGAPPALGSSSARTNSLRRWPVDSRHRSIKELQIEAAACAATRGWSSTTAASGALAQARWQRPFPSRRAGRRGRVAHGAVGQVDVPRDVTLESPMATRRWCMEVGEAEMRLSGSKVSRMARMATGSEPST